MIDIEELERIILQFNRKELTTVELLEHLLKKGYEINRSFYYNIQKLEKFQVIKIDKERKPWLIKKI